MFEGIGTAKSKIMAAALLGCVFALPAYTPAKAADLGGDCCADLEERVAELEATTVRKGNRKVSLAIKGHVNNALMIWDDGQETNAYVVTNTFSSTRTQFYGSAKITSDWSAGFYIELEYRVARGDAVTQVNDNPGGINIRHSAWWMKSEQLGKVSIGLTSPATDDLTHNSYFAAWSQADYHWGGGMALRRADTGALTATTIGAVVTGFDQARRQVVRYDTPTIGGAYVTVAWGEDDFWDVALRFKNDIGVFNIDAAVGYYEDSDSNANATWFDFEDRGFKARATITHKPTGLFAYGAYVEVDHEGDLRTAGPVTGSFDQGDEEGYMVALGIKKKWLPIGATSFWGEYLRSEDDGIRTTGVNVGGPAGSEIVGTEAERWGGGVAQWIDPAAMQLYAVFWHTDFDVDVLNAAGVAVDTPIEDFWTFAIGGRIQF